MQHRWFGMRLWMLALCATSVTVACGDNTVERASRSGKLQFALRGTAASGIEYRLRHGTFAITGASTASVSTEDNLQAENVSVELSPGEYSILLGSGWQLEAATPNGEFVSIEATLTSANPQSFTIAEKKTTSVAFRFRVGDDIIILGKGAVSISIEVDDSTAATGGVGGATAADGGSHATGEAGNAGTVNDEREPILGCPSSIAEPADAASIEGLGTLPGYSSLNALSAGLAVSPDGSAVVGVVYDDIQTGYTLTPLLPVPHAFCWTRATGMRPIAEDQGYAKPNNVNCDGTIVVGEAGPVSVYASTTRGGTVEYVGLMLSNHPFRWSAASGLSWLFPSNVIGYAFACSADGAVVVGRITPNDGSGNGSYRWTAQEGASLLMAAYVNGVQTMLATESTSFDVSADGRVVPGYTFGVSPFRPFLWTLDAGVDFFEAPYNVRRISGDGRIVVGGFSTHFWWSKDQGYHEISGAPARPMDPRAVSSRGSIIAGSDLDGLEGGTSNFIWDVRHSYRELGQLLSSYAVDISSWSNLAISDMSLDGRVYVGVGKHNGKKEAFRAVLPANTFD